MQSRFPMIEPMTPRQAGAHVSAHMTAQIVPACFTSAEKRRRIQSLLADLREALPARKVVAK